MEYEIVQMADDELAHWGVRGMRWGIRRYQNKDGSLTDKGKKRLRAEQAKVREQEKIIKNRKETQAKFDRLEARKKAVEEEKKALDNKEAAASGKKSGKKGSDGDKPVKKSMKDMSDAELRAAIERGRMEAEYDRLYPHVEKPSMMKKLTNDVLIPAAINSGKKVLEDSIKKMGEKLLGEKVDPDSIEGLKKTYEKLDLKQKIDKIKNPDKYLSEEDLSKKQKREHDAEERESQRRGYKTVEEEAKAKREAAEKKAEEDKQYYAERSRQEYERENPDPSGRYAYRRSTNNSSASEPDIVVEPRKAISAGKSFTDEFYKQSSNVVDSYGYTVRNNGLITSGRSYVSDYLALPAPKDDD